MIKEIATIGNEKGEMLFRQYPDGIDIVFPMLIRGFSENFSHGILYYKLINE
jgi:hypothetical protein